MKHYTIKPSVPGHFGPKSVFKDESARPPLVDQLHYEFDGWNGEDFVTVILTYAGTERLAKTLQDMGATGIEYAPMLVSKSGEYVQWGDMMPAELPKFIWFKITGNPAVDDFGIEGIRLVVSERVWQLLQQFNLGNCKCEERVKT